MFEFNKYKQAIKSRFELLRNAGRNITYEKMAVAAKIHKAYLSRVLNSEHAHLSEDQLYLVSQFLDLKDDETQFLQILRSLELTSVPARRKELKAKVSEYRQRHLKSDKYLETPPFNGMQQDEVGFFLDPNFALIHCFLSLDRFRKDPAAIATALSLSSARLKHYLNGLERMEFIKRSKGQYIVHEKSTHLSSDSHIYPHFRVMQRVKALARLQQRFDSNDFSFSASFTTNEQTHIETKERILNFIRKTEASTCNSKGTGVYQFNVDLFRWD